MNKFYPYLFFASVFFFALIFQTTLTSPHKTGVFYIDYSLIAVIYISLVSDISGLVMFAFFSGYALDVLSASDIGIYTISRLSLYLLIKLLITKIYSDKFYMEFGIIFLSVIYEWIIIFLARGFGSTEYSSLAFSFIIPNIFINAIAGYIFFLILREIHERIKT